MIYARKLYRRVFPVRLRTLNSLDAYALWAASYPPQAHNVLMENEQQAMLDLMPPLKDKVVLDLACGTGRYGLLAQGRGAKQVIGIDNSPDMLKASPLGNRVQATTEIIPLASASIDVILCGLALGHLPRLQPSLDEIGRVLKPNGVALVSDVHPFVALNGAQRTFSANGGVYAVEHYPHLYSDFQQAGTSSGLQIDAVREPKLKDTPIVIVYRFLRA
ncbi:MAG TPA: methyltransferase domain-containing protein [Phototrophicaceae bacterium]|nr:methyltransferase domain-containing protein [Phototrophicaceae bacterium]